MEKQNSIQKKIHYSYVCNLCGKGTEFDLDVNCSIDTDNIKSDSDKGSDVFFTHPWFINNIENTDLVVVDCPDCGCNMARVNSDFYPLCKEFIKKGYAFNAAWKYNKLCGEFDELNEKGETKLVRYYKVEVSIYSIFSDIEFRFLDDDNWEKDFVSKLTDENKEYLETLKGYYTNQDYDYEFIDYIFDEIYNNIIDDHSHKLFRNLFRFPEDFNHKIQYCFINIDEDEGKFYIMADDENNYYRWIETIPDLTNPNEVIDLIRRYYFYKLKDKEE